MIASEGKSARGRSRNRRKCRAVPQVLYLALRTTPLSPSPKHPPNPASPRAAKRRRNCRRTSLQLLRRGLAHTSVQFPARTRCTFELGFDLLAQPPHRRRDRLAKIEARVLGTGAQPFDLALECRRQLEGDRFAFLFAFENSHRSTPSLDLMTSVLVRAGECEVLGHHHVELIARPDL